MAELREGNIKEYEITPEELGLKTGKLEEIGIDSPEESARIMKSIFLEMRKVLHVRLLWQMLQVL